MCLGSGPGYKPRGARPRVQSESKVHLLWGGGGVRLLSLEVLRLCQELSAAMELQNVEFQRYVDAIRRQTGLCN